eukprot:CAMPEP_0185469462 /NCGR_PEP_ID=MMETSP1365-20130426/98245_1 /TAXON_ID=38817 /ORGANISM="Gephyrocapsa oceanica, Strain RCC1303" /LENGTH=239 /DNA_ID=CAMNT_0028076203 /DNA_START=50 /DNA_END=766 /DNA_ORIENTATION=+
MGCFSSRVEAPTEELPGPPAVEHDEPTPADTAAQQTAAALPSANDLGVPEEKLNLSSPILSLSSAQIARLRNLGGEKACELWRESGGGDLEPVLASGAVALLDAETRPHPSPGAAREAPTEELPGPPAVEGDAPTPADTAAPKQPAAALPSATDLGVSERNLELWRKKGGGDLEPVLASSAVALLDAQWIIGHAEAGGVLTHRQALPDEAFISLARLVDATMPYRGLPVAALSYPWLTK